MKAMVLPKPPALSPNRKDGALKLKTINTLAIFTLIYQGLALAKASLCFSKNLRS